MLAGRRRVAVEGAALESSSSDDGLESAPECAAPPWVVPCEDYVYV
jgi:hypothetical protein